MDVVVSFALRLYEPMLSAEKASVHDAAWQRGSGVEQGQMPIVDYCAGRKIMSFLEP